MKSFIQIKLPSSLFSSQDGRHLFLLLIIGGFIRLWGITYGLPAVYNSTEYFLAKHALSFGARHTLEPLYYIYPTFFTYTLAALFALYFLAGMLIGWFERPADFAFEFLTNPFHFYLLGRLLTSLVILLALLLFYKALRFRFSGPQSFILSLFLIFSFNVHFFTRWMVPDAFLIGGTVVVLYFMLKWLRKLATAREAILAGLVCGLTISSKYNAGFLAAGLMTAIWVYIEGKQKAARLSILAIFAILVGFFIGTPYWLLRFSEFLNGLKVIWSQAQYAYNFTTGIPYLWEVKEIVLSEYGLGILLLLASLFGILKFRREYLPFLVIIVPTFLLVGSREKKGLDYLIIIFPVLIVLMGFMIVEVRRRISTRWATTLLMLVFIPSVLHIGFYNYVHTHADTRQLASDWIIENIPAGTAICYDHYHYDLNLFDVRRFVEYGYGARFLSDEVKNRLQKIRNSPGNYRFISPLKNRETPAWPEHFSQKQIARFRDDPFVVEALKHPFKTIQEIQSEGAQWLILNGETYLKYLKNPPPSPANPLRENFVRKVQFYERLFQQYRPRVVFAPELTTPGPMIQIFYIEK